MTLYVFACGINFYTSFLFDSTRKAERPLNSKKQQAEKTKSQTRRKADILIIFYIAVIIIIIVIKNPQPEKITLMLLLRCCCYCTFFLLVCHLRMCVDFCFQYQLHKTRDKSVYKNDNMNCCTVASLVEWCLYWDHNIYKWIGCTLEWID